MEKISIARRRPEKQATLFPVKTDCPELSQESISTAFSLPLLESLIVEEANTCQNEIKKFIVEITSGLEKPIKMTVSIQSLNSAPSKKEFYTVAEAVKILSISKKTLYRQLQQGNLSGLKVGKQWRVLLAHQRP